MKTNFICCICWILLCETFARDQTQPLPYIFLMHGEKHSTPSLTQTDFRAGVGPLETILQILLLKKALIILYGVK